MTETDIIETRQILKSEGVDRVLVLSGVTGQGVKEVLRAIGEMVAAARAAEKPAEVEAWQP